MIKKYNNMSFLFGVPGLVLQAAGNFVDKGEVMSGMAWLKDKSGGEG